MQAAEGPGHLHSSLFAFSPRLLERKVLRRAFRYHHHHECLINVQLTMEYRSQGPPMFVPVVLRSRNARARGSHRAVGPSSDELLRLLSSDLSMVQSQDWGFPPLLGQAMPNQTRRYLSSPSQSDPPSAF